MMDKEVEDESDENVEIGDENTSENTTTNNDSSSENTNNVEE